MTNGAIQLHVLTFCAVEDLDNMKNSYYSHSVQGFYLREGLEEEISSPSPGLWQQP